MYFTRITLTICATCLAIMAVSAQEASQTESIPFGTPIIRIFANVHQGLSSGDQSKAFEARRVYLGYKADLNPNFSTEVKVDIGSPEEISEEAQLKRYAYFKNAALYWKKGMWNVRGGIIDTEHYRRQEKYWKHRYIYKSMQDEHRFGPKADLGTTVIFTPMDQLSFDASIMNGEGYTNLQRDNAFKYSGAVSYFPNPEIILRVYYDIITKDVDQHTLSTFACYQSGKFTGGAEYNRKFNRDYESGQHQTGLSAYLSYDLTDKFELFGRYDVLLSNTLSGQNDPWNQENDGSAIISGIQFQPIKYVKLALNYQGWVPAAANAGTLSFIFLNLEVSL